VSRSGSVGAEPGARREPGGVSPVATLLGPLRRLECAVRVPASKSLTNRALVAAAVAGGGTVLDPLDADDTRHLAVALGAMGWPVRWDRAIDVGPRRREAGPAVLDLRDSGTGARFILALAAAVPGRWKVDGSRRLRERPVAPLLESLRSLGAELEASGERLPVRVAGRELVGGAVRLRPEVSSQFVSALLLAAPLMTRPLEVTVDGPTPSRPYLDLTEDVLRSFGAAVRRDGDRWTVARGDMAPTSSRVEGDWSAAAFFLAAAAVAGGRVTVGPLDPTSRQGDRLVMAELSEGGMTVEPAGDGVRAVGPLRRPFEVDLRDAPDLFPALAVAAAAAPPGSRIRGLEHLRHKESDRLSVMARNLERLGAGLETDGSSASFTAPIRTLPAVRDVEAAGDHRIAMAMAVAALAAGPLRLDDPDAVSKSFPAFWREWRTLAAGATGPGGEPTVA